MTLPTKAIRDNTGKILRFGDFKTDDILPEENGGTGLSGVSQLIQALNLLTVEDAEDHTNNQQNPHAVTAQQLGALLASALGQENGAAPLDTNAKIPSIYLPTTTLPRVYVVNTEAQRLALSPIEADECRVLDTRTHYIFANDGNWYEYEDTRNVHGSLYEANKSFFTTTTTRTNFIEKLSLFTSNLPSGDYELTASYGWNCNSTSRDFVSRITRNGTQEGEEHRQEPQDSAGSFGSTGSDQKNYVTRIIPFLGMSGSQAFKLELRSGSNGTAVSMWDASMSILRVA